MKKILQIFAITLASLFGLLLALICIIKLIPDTQYRSWISSAVESATGREFNMQSLELDLGTSLRVSADGVKLANPEWADNPDMLSIKHLDAQLRLLPLFSGKAELRATVDSADIAALINADGVSNWEMASATKKTAVPEEDDDLSDDHGSQGLPIMPLIRELRINDVRLGLQTGAGEAIKDFVLNQLSILTPELDTTLELEASANGIPVKISSNLGNIEQALEHTATPFNLAGHFDQNLLDIKGQWGPMLPDNNLNLNVDFKVPSTSSVAALAGYEVGDFGQLEITAQLSADKGLYRVDNITSKMDGEEHSTSIDGSVANLFLMDGVDLGIEVDTAALGDIIQKLNIELPVPLPPEVHISARLQGGIDDLNLNNVVADVRDEGVQFSLTGSIAELLGDKQVTAQFNASADGLSRFSKYADMPLPDLGQLALSGKLQSVGKSIALQALDTELSADNLLLAINGDIENLLTVDGIKLQTAVDIKSLSEQNKSELAALFEALKLEVPLELLPQSVMLNTQIQGNLESLGLNDISANITDPGIQIGINGAVGNVLKAEGVTANITLNSDSIAAFSKYASTELPDLGPLEATAKIVSNQEIYQLDSLLATLSAEPLNASINASMDDLIALTGLKAEIQASTPSLSLLSGLAQTDLPETDPVNIDATLTGKSLEQALLAVEASTAGATVTANSTLSLLDLGKQLVADLTLQARSLTDFNKLAQKEFPDEGPLKFSSSIKIEPNNFKLDDLKLSFSENQSASGNLVLNLPEPEGDSKLTRLHGKLDIPFLDLTPFMPEPVPVEGEDEVQIVEEAAEELTEDAVPEEENLFENELSDEPLEPSERLLSSEPFLLDALHNYDIDLAINAERLDLRKAQVKDIQLVISLQEGLLDVRPITARGGQNGDLSGHIQLDGRQSTPSLDTEITLNQFPMPNLGGSLDVHWNVEGKGVSVAELMASLNGQILLVAKDGEIDKSFASRFGSGMFSFSGGSEKTTIECGILRMDIVDGVVDFKKKLAAQLTEVTWRGGGQIDFNTERISADIVPKPRKGIPISVGGGLAGLVALSGTLKNPKIAPDYSDAAIKYGKYSAYVATGGLSFLAEMIANKITANADVCEKILDGTVFDDEDKSAKKNPPR